MKGRILTENQIAAFAVYLKSEEKSKNTIEKYIRDVRAFFNHTNGTEITKETVITYKNKLLTDNYAARSVNSMLASINSLLLFLGWANLKVKSIKLQRQIYCTEEKELTKAEYMRLVNTAKQKGNERLNLLLQTICGTGIRVSELKYITVESIKCCEAVVSLKGKTRSVFIVRELQKKLLQYAKRQKIKSGAIFITRSGKPMSRTNIWREMKNLCVQAGVSPQKVFPHNLRHLFARTFYGIEKDIAKLADILGHSSIKVPNVKNLTESEARYKLKKAGFHVKTKYVYENCDASKNKSSVLSQSLNGKHNPGSTVTLRVTKPSVLIQRIDFEHNSVGGVDIEINFKNASNKTIKYIYFNTRFKNAVGDDTYCEIKNKCTARLMYTGPLYSGSSQTTYWDAITYDWLWSATKNYIESRNIYRRDGSWNNWYLNETFTDQSLEIYCHLNSNGTVTIDGSVSFYRFTDFSSLSEYCKATMTNKTFKISNLKSIPSSYDIDKNTTLKYSNGKFSIEYSVRDDYSTSFYNLYCCWQSWNEYHLLRVYF